MCHVDVKTENSWVESYKIERKSLKKFPKKTRNRKKLAKDFKPVKNPLKHLGKVQQTPGRIMLREDK